MPQHAMELTNDRAKPGEGLCCDAGTSADCERHAGC
jgi:hypothetical protein